MDGTVFFMPIFGFFVFYKVRLIVHYNAYNESQKQRRTL